MRSEMDTDVMVQDLRTLVECESPSGDVAATTNCAKAVAELGERWLGAAPQVLRTGERVALLWSWAGPQRRLVLGHLDTVWPMGTLARWPFTHDAERASGPGCFDMKAGIVQAMHAIASLENPSGVQLLLTSDEEIGAPDSRPLIEQVARDASAVYVPEPSAAAALKVERKGVSLYAVQVTGRAAHAGLEPELGVNASIELAHQVLAVAGLQDVAAGTTVTPTVLSAGTTTNTVPAAGQIRVDVRARSEAEQDRVDAAIQALAPVLEGASLRIEGGKNRPPLERHRSEALLARAVQAYRELGYGELGAVAVGGASDGNFTAGLGIPTLDGLGAVGDGAHAEGEWVSVPDLARRARLLATLVRPDEPAR